MVKSKTSREDAREHNMNNRFFQLPGELRNMIYQDLLISTPIIFTQWVDAPVTLCLHGTAQDGSNSSSGLPLWLMTCEAFLHEGRVVLEQIFNLTVGPYHPHVNTGRDPDFQIVTPSSKATITIRTDSIDALLYPRGACFQLGIVGLTTLEHVLGHLQMEAEDEELEDRKLRFLRVQASFLNVCSVCQWYTRHVYSNSNEQTTWNMDLSCLEKFELNLDIFEFEVRNIDTTLAQDGLFHATNHWAEVEQTFEEEVIRVGEALTRDFSGAFSKSVIISAQQKAALFRFERRALRHTNASAASQHQWSTGVPTRGRKAIFQRRLGF